MACKRAVMPFAGDSADSTALAGAVRERHLDVPHGSGPVRGGVEDLLDHHLWRAQHPAPYVSAATLPELHDKVVLGVQSAAGFAEGHPLPTGCW